MATVGPGGGRPLSPTPSQLPPLPGSPSYSFASTANPLSAYNLPPPPPPRPAHAVLTRADLEQSQTAYADLISTAKAYRVALAALSTAASAFGSALESCARLKEARAEPISHTPAVGGGITTTATANSSIAPTTPGGPPPPPPRPGSACTADLLMSASGMQHLIANHQQIVSETVYRSFELPLLHELDKWRRSVDEEEEMYRSAVANKSAEIRRMEREGLSLHRQKRRDVGRFRAHLVDLTTKLDSLTTLHADHSRALLGESQETSTKILDASCSLVRAEVDIFESLARKGWSGGGLEDLLERGIDLFASEPDPGVNADSAKLFSILPPKSILADTNDSVGGGGARPGHHGHARSDSLLDTTYQSLTAVAAEHQRAADAESTSDFNRPRNSRPFSPQPIRRVPTDVTNDDSLAVGALPNRPAINNHQRSESEGDMTMSLSLSLGPELHGDDDEDEDEDEDEDDEHDEGTIRGEGEYDDHGDDSHDDDSSGNSTNDSIDGSRPWRNEGLVRSVSGEIGKDLGGGGDERRKRWSGDDDHDEVE